MHGN